MAKVPGLTPQTEGRPSGGRNPGRVATNGPGFRAPGLTPTARPVDTYARPQQGPKTNSALQLAESLAQISPGLKSMLMEEGMRRKQDAEDMANRRIGGMSFEEAQKAVNEGTISEMDNPWFKAAFMKQYGERLANHRVNEITAHYETEFDKDGGNLDAYIAEQMKGDLDQYGDNRFFVEAYGRKMEGFTAQANQKQTQYQTERTVEQTHQGVYENFLGEARNMLAAGATPEEIAQALRGQYAGNRELLNVDFKNQDRELLRVAKALAEDGQHEVVQALLGTSTTMADGTVLGPIGDNRDFSTDSATITNRAERQKFEKTEKATYDRRMGFFEAAQTGTLDEEDLLAFHQSNEGAYSDANVQSLLTTSRRVQATAQAAKDKLRNELLLQQQSLRSNQELIENDLQAVETGMVPYLEDATVLDEHGNEKTISAETRKKNVSKEVVDRIDAKVDAGELTPEQGFALEVQKFSANGLPNPKWSSVLEAGPITASPQTLTGDKVPPALQEGIDLYMKLHATNPRLLQTNLKDRKALDYYESYRVATQYGRMEPGQAMAVAQKQTDDPTGFEDGYFRPRQEEITSKVRSLQSNGFFRFFGVGTPAVKNEGYVGNEIARLSQFYARNGLGTEQSLTLAKERFEQTHSQVNGNWLYTADKHLPPDFSAQAQRMLEDYVKANPNEDLDIDDLSVQPATNGSGAWTIIDRTGMPVENGKSRTFTLRAMGQRAQAREQEARQKVIDDTNAEIEGGRYDPWIVINENSFIGPWLGSNPNPQEQEYVRRRAKEISDSRKAKP